MTSYGRTVLFSTLDKHTVSFYQVGHHKYTVQVDYYTGD